MKHLPYVVHESGKYQFILDDKPFIMLAAETHNSAASSPDYMKYVWQKAVNLNCNTILVPVYWELIESEENCFDYSLLESTISGARQHGFKLVLLWFGSWKNGLSTYAPRWVRTDLKRFPRTIDQKGARTKILSIFNSDLQESERNAFEKFLIFLRQYDAKQQTVIAIQIENEVGILGAARDYSEAANKLFQGAIPPALLENYTHLSRKSDFASELDSLTTWKECFGEEADEIFMAWNYASYINNLAFFGKKIYPLPMYTNVWLNESDIDLPGTYPSGGAVPRILSIWKFAAPLLDFISPDIYTFNFEDIANSYRRPDNPLFVAETRRDKWAVANLYLSIGEYHTLCYSPFGLESIGENKSYITQIEHSDVNDLNVSNVTIADYLAMSYMYLKNMIPTLSRGYGTKNLRGFCQKNGMKTTTLTIEEYQIDITFYHSIDENNKIIPGAGIVLLSEKYLYFCGYGYRASVKINNDYKELDFLLLEKGAFNNNGEWERRMILNGDEQYIRMEERPTIIRASFFEYDIYM